MKKTISEIKAMNQDQLTNYTSCYESGDGNTYFTLTIPVEGQDDICITSKVYDEEFSEADTPEYYEAWERHWPGMLTDLQDELADR